MAFYVAPALRPRMLLTVDEDGSVVPVSVRVGAAVDTVAQAGKPKAITGAGSSLRTLQWILFLPCRERRFAEGLAQSRWTGAVLVCKCLLANAYVVMMGAQSCLMLSLARQRHSTGMAGALRVNANAQATLQSGLRLSMLSC